MRKPRKLRSFRQSLFHMIGAMLLVFLIAFIAVFQVSVYRTLADNDINYMNGHLRVIEGELRASEEALRTLAADIACRDEIVRFALGNNEDLIARNGSVTPLLQTYGLSFIVFQDASGGVIHTDFWDSLRDETVEAPWGFTDTIGRYAREALQIGAAHAPVSGYDGLAGTRGIMMCEGAPYLVAVAPIMPEGLADTPVGTVAIGYALNNAFFRAQTFLDAYTFSLAQAMDEPEAPGAGYLFDRPSAGTISAGIPLADLDGNRLILTVTGPRTGYLEGRQAMTLAALSLSAIVAVFVLLLYLISARKILKPVEALSADVGMIVERGGVDPHKYSDAREYVELCAAINGMLERLKQSNISLDLFARILNGMNAYLFVSDIETNEVIFANGKICERFGVKGDPVGMPCWKLAQPDAEGRCGNCPVAWLRKHPNETVSWELQSSDNGRYYQNTDSLIDWLDDRQAHLHYQTDITDVKTAQNALNRRLKQQEIMSRIAENFIQTPDLDAFILYMLRVSGEFVEAGRTLITRVNPESGLVELYEEWHNGALNLEKIGSNFRPYAHGHPIYDEVVAKGSPYVAIDDTSASPMLKFLARDGVRSSLSLPIRVGGRLWGILNVAMIGRLHKWTDSDIHLFTLIVNVVSAVVTRKQGEQELIRMSSIVGSTPNFIVYFLPGGAFEYVNDGAVEATGFSTAELYERGAELFLKGEDLRRFRYETIPQIEAKGKLEFPLAICRRNGEERTLQITAFKVGEGAARGYGAIGSDITERLRLEQALVEAKVLAESSNHAKSDFLSRMSHEMRTPMNAIIGMAHMARTSGDLKRMEYCLNKIDEASSHLLGVINDILDMSKIEANKFELSFSEFDLEKMLQRVANINSFRIEEKEQVFSIEIGDGIPPFIVSDEQRLSQVITNLISNATKFTPVRGAISLSVGLLSEADGVCTLRFAVRDTGIGVSSEQQSRLFHSFEQADGSVSRRFGGTGLGLAISKRIVELMGGRIWVESALGEGSSFIFTMCAKRGVTMSRRSVAAEVDLKSLRVLVVDSAPEVRQFFTSLAKTIGFQCVVAKDGLDARRIVESGEPFGITFIDWRAPGMEGLSLIHWLKARGDMSTWIIMASAAEIGEAETEAKGAGVTWFVSKPLFSSLVVDCINERFGKGSEPFRPVCEADERGRYAGRIMLLAEDVEINREIVLSLLDGTDITVDQAENGVEAFRLFRENPARYDIIMMDIHMPEMDGYESTRRIRSLPVPQAKSTPIVAMTANVFREDVERCLAAGMNDHIGKPINVDEFFTKLRRNIRG